MKILVIDTETTGIAADRYEVCEVALVAYDDGVEVGAVSAVLKTYKPWDMRTVAIHGITPEMSAEGREPLEVCQRIQRWIDGSDAMVAFNHKFDSRHMASLFMSVGMPWVPKPWIDPSTIARRFITSTECSSRKLESLCKWAGIELDGAHQALQDTRATGLLLFQLADRFGLDLWAEISGASMGIAPAAYGLPPFEALLAGYRDVS